MTALVLSLLATTLFSKVVFATDEAPRKSPPLPVSSEELPAFQEFQRGRNKENSEKWVPQDVEDFRNGKDLKKIEELQRGPEGETPGPAASQQKVTPSTGEKIHKEAERTAERVGNEAERVSDRVANQLSRWSKQLKGEQ